MSLLGDELEALIHIALNLIFLEITGERDLSVIGINGRDAKGLIDTGLNSQFVN